MARAALRVCRAVWTLSRLGSTDREATCPYTARWRRSASSAHGRPAAWGQRWTGGGRTGTAQSPDATPTDGGFSGEGQCSVICATSCHNENESSKALVAPSVALAHAVEEDVKRDTMDGFCRRPQLTAVVKLAAIAEIKP